MLLELIGAVAAVASVSVAIPQLLKVIRSRHANGVSATAWSLMLASALCWASYGILVGLPAEVGCNVAAVAVDIAVIAFACHHGHPTMFRRSVCALLLAAALVAIAIVFDPTVVATAAIAMGAAVYVPYVVHLRRAADLSGVAPGTFAVNAAAAALWCAYGLGHHDFLVWGPCVPSIAASVALAWYVTRRQTVPARVHEFPTGEVRVAAA